MKLLDLHLEAEGAEEEHKLELLGDVIAHTMETLKIPIPLVRRPLQPSFEDPQPGWSDIGRGR